MLFPPGLATVRGAVLAVLAVLPSLALLLTQNPPAPAGKGQRVTLQADAAWIEPGRRIAPAFVVVEDGKVQAVSSTQPRQAGTLVVLKGTLAPAMVDAWSRLVPADLLADGHPLPYQSVAASLPADLPGADPALAARVAGAIRSGVGAAWLSGGAPLLQRGLATPAAFSAHDLPVAAGQEALEFALGSARFPDSAAAVLELERFAELLESAKALREAREEHLEKMEKYQKDLEEYHKKLDEYIKKKEEADKAGKKEEGGGQKEGAQEQKQEAPQEGGARGRAGEAGARARGGEAPKEAEKKDGPPKRPERPKEPERDPAKELVLAALDREYPVRVEAHSSAEIRRLLELKRAHGFDLVLVGGSEADWVGAELAAEDVPVVLAAVPQHHGEADAERSFARRYLALRRAGVPVALGSGGADGAQALLSLRAGEIVAAGGDPDDVWAALTTVPARILGLSGTHGSLRSGAAAVFVLFEGASPFDASAPFRGLRY
ncbi:MAG: hypothetical protein EYC70_05400 [Planctomycetota bacterium]|nr:MAG: hypothetical protein EYC70_05400 [Planctomycetota bacterium]